MYRTFPLTILVGLCLGAACASAADAPKSMVGSAADEATIRKIILGRADSFNRHETPAPGSFTADADFVNAYGMWRKGPEEIEARQGERMKTVLKDAQIKLVDVHIRFIRSDVAIVHQKHEMSGMLGAEGAKLPPQEELSIRVMVKERGEWLTTAFHNTIVRANEGSAAGR